jgi:hypothetical protein
MTGNEHNPSNSEQKRGVGPFTGWQLTTIVLAALLALAIPAGAFAAATGSNAFVTDHSTGAHASVNATTGLSTSDTPAIGGIDLTVSGDPGTSCAFTPPTGKAFVITGVTMDPHGATVGNDTSMFIAVGSTSNCSNLTRTLAGGYYSADGSYTTTFSPGVGLANGHSLQVTVVGANDPFWIFVRGYLVPAAACKSTFCD